MVLLSLRAFLRLEVYRLRTRRSWYEAKAAILRDTIRAYLAYPPYELIPIAQVLLQMQRLPGAGYDVNYRGLLQHHRVKDLSVGGGDQDLSRPFQKPPL